MEHDIRTPLVGMIGLSDVLSDLLDNDTHQELTDDIKGCASQLLDYCNRIFELSKNEDINMRVQHELVCLNDIVDEVKSMFVPAVKNKQLELLTCVQQDESSSILADRFRLQRILLNLVATQLNLLSLVLSRYPYPCLESVRNHSLRFQLKIAVLAYLMIRLTIYLNALRRLATQTKVSFRA